MSDKGFENPNKLPLWAEFIPVSDSPTEIRARPDFHLNADHADTADSITTSEDTTTDSDMPLALLSAISGTTNVKTNGTNLTLNPAQKLFTFRGTLKLLDTYGFNIGDAGYRSIKTFRQSDAKPAMILLAPVYADTYLAKNGFIGTVYRNRGASGAFNISEIYGVICTTAYKEARLNCTGSTPDVRIVQTTYNDTDYYALYFPSKSENRITLDGLFWGKPIEISDATNYPVTEVTYNIGPYAIVESGSNSSGNWIKFSDGTMIQIGLCLSYNGLPTGPGGWKILTLPVSFTVRVSCYAIPDNWVGMSSAIRDSESTNQQLQVYNRCDDSNDTAFHWAVIGRWK